MTFEWLPTIMTGLFSAGLGSFLTYRISLQKEGRSDFDKITEKWEADNQRLREEMSKALAETRELREEITGLQYLVRMLDSAESEIPLPAWTKDIGGTVRAINTAYEVEFLRPFGLIGADCLGKHDSEIWSAETCDHTRHSDSDALSSTDRYSIGQEELVNATGVSLGHYVVLKYLIRADGAVMGIRALAIPRRAIK